MTVTVLDLSKPDAQQRVGRWEFGPKDSEPLWHSGFFGSGYVVRVPWQTLPDSPQLLVHARLRNDRRPRVRDQPVDPDQMSLRRRPKSPLNRRPRQAARCRRQPRSAATNADAASCPASAPPASLDTAMTRPPDTAVNQAGARSTDDWWSDGKKP